MRRELLFFLIIFSACSNIKDDPYRPNGANSLFTRLRSETTGLEFENTVSTTSDLNVFRYRNFYNGGGVGLGDFNNDGLTDVFLTSNMGDNKLFLNKGSWKFEDITTSAGVKGAKAWSTGVSIVDINADGFLDIYVCNAGDVQNGNRENELFINKGNLTFKESAAEFGLADRGFSTHAAFFDYDKDGDLDCYVLNNSYKPVSSLGYRNLRHVRDEFGGHKLYRNDNGKFTDISEAAGIYGSVIGFGLGVTVGDVNQDSWPDLYVSNDFYERDYLYINNGNGTFNEELESHMGHISMFSMGADIADLNNDGYPEIFSTDMLPDDDIRLKTLTAFETYDVYQLRLKNGYYHQFMRNMMHLNNRDGSFTEVGSLAGVAATDWSWGALIADFNNDRNKEIYVCNGIYKDLINQDFVEYLGSSDQMRTAIEGKEIDFEEFTEKMPSEKVSNFMFVRQSELQYKNVAEEWGLGEPSF
ncbi:MAG TPA: VCBS repeat-containing protein, partial [Chryseolinea sp.]|nr:VCBS repeat-containing protein [Chryseolinea sp.]